MSSRIDIGLLVRISLRVQEDIGDVVQTSAKNFRIPRELP